MKRRSLFTSLAGFAVLAKASVLDLFREAPDERVKDWMYWTAGWALAILLGASLAFMPAIFGTPDLFISFYLFFIGLFLSSMVFKVRCGCRRRYFERLLAEAKEAHAAKMGELTAAMSALRKSS